jgi:hypothetical protein
MTPRLEKILPPVLIAAAFLGMLLVSWGKSPQLGNVSPPVPTAPALEDRKTFRPLQPAARGWREAA